MSGILQSIAGQARGLLQNLTGQLGPLTANLKNWFSQPVVKAPQLAEAMAGAETVELAEAVEEYADPQPVEQTPIEPDYQSAESVMADAAVAAAPARSLSFDMDLPGDDSPSVLARLQRAKWHRVRYWGMRGVAVFLVLILTLGGLLFSQAFLKAHKVFKGGAGTAAALNANVNPDLLKGEGSGRINILLLGRGGGTHDAPDLTDTMMVASVDPINHKTALISIPRDLWVNVPNAGVMKINAAWETGVYKYLGSVQTNTTNAKAIAAGYDEVDQVVQSVLGINIDYNAVVDFQAFKQAVNTVGGVTIDVPANLVDPTMAWENHHNPVLAKAGIDTFNGDQALLYVRSRETSSDFARSQRQRAMLLALKDKVDTLGTLSNPLKISGLISAFGNNVSTDLSIKDASRLYGILHKVSDNNIISVGFADGTNHYVTTGNINGQSIVLPTAGLFDYSDIQAYVRSQLKDPFILKEHAKILVLNGSTVPGLATAEANNLKSYGYNVVGAGNTPNTGWTQTTLINLSGNKDKYTLHYLEEHFKQTAETHLADSTIQTNGADFVIIMGSNDASLTTNQAN
ncbi:MAG TPA: LCP family protein [Candidatus Saccharimonadales bacterium]|nr:LCP family protein [Candidatus Saccharimonadales bacterium]